MRDGQTCYERDEILCEDQMCLRAGCRLRNERLGGMTIDTGGRSIDDYMGLARRRRAVRKLYRLAWWERFNSWERGHYGDM